MSKPFTGHSAEMRKETPWLASEDILGRGDIPVEIAGVWFEKGVKFEDARKTDCFSLSFKGKKKKMVLNATNRMRLVLMFGPLTSEWIGKPVVLYVDPKSKKFGGGTTNGLRIRLDERRWAGAHLEQHPEPVPTDEDMDAPEEQVEVVEAFVDDTEFPRLDG